MKRVIFLFLLSIRRGSYRLFARERRHHPRLQQCKSRSHSEAGGTDLAPDQRP